MEDLKHLQLHHKVGKKKKKQEEQTTPQGSHGFFYPLK
jgi:hypothetical protein